MIGRPPALTKVGGHERKSTIKTKGGTTKHRLFESQRVNLIDPKTKKHVTATIKAVVENPANRNFVRRNILTKGTLLETDKGQARVTSRPGQDGIINAVKVN